MIAGKSILRMGPAPGGRYSKEPPQGFLEAEERLPLTVEGIDTKGKFMWWTLRSGPDTLYMWCTYGMSGQWMPWRPDRKNEHICFDIEHDGGRLCFYDPRHFGTIKFVFNESEHDKKLASLGPCILSGQLTPEVFAENILSKPNRTLSEALMDQTAAAGIGNYIKAECAYRAGISPWRRVIDISSAEYVSLTQQVIDVAEGSYASQGATISTYRTPSGQRGTTQFDFMVYSRRRCPRGHDVIRETTPDARTSHWCKICQT